MRRLLLAWAMGPLSFLGSVLAAELPPPPAPAAAPAVAPEPGPATDPDLAPAPASDPDLAPAPDPAADPDLAPAPDPAADPDLAPAPDPAAAPNSLIEAPDEEPADEILDVDSFAIELEALGLAVQWSGYGDVTFEIDSKGKNTFDVSHFNPILSARLGPLVRAEIELEFEHSGASQKVEYAFVDFAFSRAFNLRAGKLLVPIGRFNAVLHPSFRWHQISRPAMFRDVIPAVWSDVGIDVFGTVRLGAGHLLSYDAYVVNGLGADTDLSQEAEPIRALRSNFLDLDRDKGLGARLGLRLFQSADVGATELGVSFYTGGVRASDDLRYSAIDVDLNIRLGPLVLLAELAQSFLGTGSHAFDAFETGLYTQLAWQLGRFLLTTRLDTTLTKPMLAVHGAWHHQLVPGIAYAPESFWSARLEASLPVDGSGEPARFSAMTAFSF